MKKVLFFMMLGLAVCSCSNDEGVVLPGENNAETTLRTKEEAVSIAEKFNATRQEEGSRATAKIVKSVEVIRSTESRNDSDPLIYVINYEDNEGFALVSAAKAGIAVIGFSDEGNFDVEAAEESSNTSYYLDAAKEYVAGMTLSSGPIVDPTIPETLTQMILNHVEVEWGESYPEGIFCSNTLAGCVQTTMAQMMSYLEKPTSLTLTYPDRDVDTQLLNWSEIKKHKKSIVLKNKLVEGDTSGSDPETHLAECEGSEDVHKVIGRLCRQLGYMNNATYVNLSTYVSSNKYYSTFQTLCPSNTFTNVKDFNDDYSNLWNDLYANPGVAYIQTLSLFSTNNVWLCDGGYHYITTTNVLKYDGTYEKLIEHEYYYHFNWSNCGKNNGYFEAGVFNRNNPTSRAAVVAEPQYFVVYK